MYSMIAFKLSNFFFFPFFIFDHHSRSGKHGCRKVSKGISNVEKELILNLHNNYRSEVARGAAVVGNTTLPSGRAMSKMVKIFHRFYDS
jgi:hypothetical protein